MSKPSPRPTKTTSRHFRSQRMRSQHALFSPLSQGALAQRAGVWKHIAWGPKFASQTLGFLCGAQEWRWPRRLTSAPASTDTVAAFRPWRGFRTSVARGRRGHHRTAHASRRWNLAERGGFEPPKRGLDAYTLSRRAPSTTRTPLRTACGHGPAKRARSLPPDRDPDKESRGFRVQTPCVGRGSASASVSPGSATRMPRSRISRASTALP